MAPAGRSRTREEVRRRAVDTATDGTTVGEAMLTVPATHGPDLSVAGAWAALGDSHRHLLLLVSDGRLVGTLGRGDLDAAGTVEGPALHHATLVGRTVRAHEPLAAVHADMLARGQRRRAVVDDDGRLLGLLCLKSSGSGFCSDEGVDARQRERRARASGTRTLTGCPAREG